MFFKSGGFVAVFVLALSLVVASSGQAQSLPDSSASVSTVPRIISFNGVIKTSSGQTPSGVVGLTFSMYKDQQGGAPVWSETQNVQTDEFGRYAILLGSTQPGGLPAELFNSMGAQWLGVQLQMSGEAEQPRVFMVSVPFALKAGDAETLGGKPLSSFVLSGPATDGAKASASTASGSTVVVAADKLAPSTFAISGTGTTNKVTKWADTNGTVVDSAIFEANGQVGINTTSPIGAFNVTTSGSPNYLTLSSYQADSLDKGFLLRTARGTAGAPLPVQSGNALFNMYGQGADGTDFSLAAGITMVVDGSVSTGKVPGAILLQTADSTGSFGERMRINAAGNVGVGTVSPSAKLEVAGNFTVSGGGVISGNGSGITGINASNISLGTISNAATSGTSSNVPNTLVLRDGSGNFTANTITASNVSGNGSGLTNVAAASLAGVNNTSLRTRSIVYLAGCDNCSVLSTADSQKNIYFNLVGPMTINSITCFSDTGSPKINIQRDDGSPTNMLSGDLTCNSTSSGGSSSSFISGENSMNANDKLDFYITDPGASTTHRLTVAISATVN
jgi:hypothetical protein